MQLTLKREDIVAALKSHIQNIGFDLSNSNVEVNFVAGRKDNGLTATIDITMIAKPVPVTLIATGSSMKRAVMHKEAAPAKGILRDDEPDLTTAEIDLSTDQAPARRVSFDTSDDTTVTGDFKEPVTANDEAETNTEQEATPAKTSSLFG